MGVPTPWADQNVRKSVFNAAGNASNLAALSDLSSSQHDGTVGGSPLKDPTYKSDNQEE